MDRIIQAIPILTVVLALGFCACLPLYNWNLYKFVTSSLGIKVLMWIPLYLFFAIVAGGDFWILAFIVGLIALIACVEFLRAQNFVRAWWYFAYFIVTLASWFGSVFAVSSPSLWMALCLTSVFSDVFAFFLGNYVGAHKFPKFINPHKSYEGALGQIIGGVLGSIVFGMIFSAAIPWWVGFLVGVASLGGDILNSIAKRVLGIKDWGNTIAGHGGMMDRFSSLNLALTAIWMIYSVIF